jgi:hypothetical protein
MSESILITQVGSLPHGHVDSALEYSFRHDLPFLPQLPQLSRNELMLSQALQNMPGLYVDEDREARIELKTWMKGKSAYEEVMNKALDENEFHYFLPKREFYQAWPGFLFELEERGVKQAKIQLAGPFTTQLIVKLADGEGLKDYPEINQQILKSITLQSFAMVDALKERGVTPYLFIDEPGLFAMNEAGVSGINLLQELKLLIIGLRKRGAKVGLHVCAQTDWNIILNLGMDFLSFDVECSWKFILEAQESLLAFVKNGGQLCPGIFATHREGVTLAKNFIPFLESFGQFHAKERPLLLSPACGLASKSIKTTEDVYNDLLKFRTQLQSKFY